VIEFDDAAAGGRTAASGAPDSVAADGSGSAPGGARSWSDLIDVTEDVLEISGTSTGAGAGVDAAGQATPTIPASTPPTAAPAATSTPPALGSEARMPSTQKASFAAMLSAIARDTVTGDGVAATTVNTDNTPDSTASDSGGSGTIADIATGDTATNSAPAGPTPAADAPVATGERMAVAATPPWPITAGGTLTGAWIDAIAAAAPQPAHVLAADLFTDEAAHASEASLVADSGATVQPALSALGLPDGLLPEHTVLSCLEALSTSEDAQTYVEVALTSALQHLPDAPVPPHRPGSLLVMVGDLDRSLECAAALAYREGIDVETIVVASQARHRRGVAARLLVSSPEEAADLAERSRRLPHPLIVAMHAPVSAEPDRWATRMLAALAPTAVWGVAPATHKSEDLAAWAEGLGGLDALALEDLSSTTSPADVLAAGIPVASLDGRHATPALWAALIAARLLLARVAGRTSTGAIEGA
jgi:hypothetical protein